MYLLLHNLAGFMYQAALYRHGIFTLQFAHQHVNSRCIFVLKHSSTLYISCQANNIQSKNKIIEGCKIPYKSPVQLWSN